MITRPSPQLVIKSTAGTKSSVYLREKVDDGRERVESGLDGHVYYLEYAANPEAGDDIHNPEHWHRWMPALGYTQSLKALTREHSGMKPDEWARAFCNVWTATLDRIIPLEPWNECRDPLSEIERPGRLWMGADASPSLTGNRTAAITVSGYRADGLIHDEVIEHHPGIGWVAEAIGALSRARGYDELYIDPKSPLGAVITDIEREANVNIHLVDAAELGAACTRFHEDVVGAVNELTGERIPSRMRHLGQDALDAAAEGAAKRVLLDSWAFARRTSTADICPLVSAVLSHWGAASNPTRGIVKMG